MATVRTAIDSTVYTEVSTATDALVQNVSPNKLLLIFAASLPAVGATNFHVMEPNEAVQKISGLPAGNIYVRTYMDNREGFVAVSE
jgi:hypothetical protein